MKKLVLVAAMFMFVCGGSFLAQARGSVQHSSEVTLQTNDTVVTDTVKTVLNTADTVKVAE